MSDDLQLIEKIKSYNSYVDEKIIKNAYKYASEAHNLKDILEILTLATSCCKYSSRVIRWTHNNNCALHDTIEDTEATFNEVKNLEMK